MTVIFHTNVGAPVLAGDMLVSVPGPDGQTELKLPSQPNGIVIPPDLIPNYLPVKMRRKVFIVNDHMAVGAAGTVKCISKFIEDLTHEFHNKSKFTYADIRNFLDIYRSSNLGGQVLEQVDAIILAEATDWQGSLTSGQTSRNNIISNHYGKVIAIGTGSSSIISQVQRIDNQYKIGFSQPPDGKDEFPEFKTLAGNLMLFANIYWKEFISPDNLFEAWGGAYDLIYQNTEKVFQYLDEYTIFLRLFDADQAENGIQLMNVLKYERRSDFSFIIMHNGGKLDFFGAKDVTASDAPKKVYLGSGGFSMNSKVHISIIAVSKGNKLASSPLIQIDGLDTAEKTNQTVFTSIDEEGRLRIVFHAEHDKWLTEQAMSFYQRNANSFS